MSLWIFGHFNLSASYLENYLSYGLEIWSADKGWWVDYMIKFKKKKKIQLIFFPELWPFENLGILNLSARYLRKYLR